MLPGVPNIATAGVAILPNINPARFSSMLQTAIQQPVLGAVAGVATAAGAVLTASLGTAVSASNAFVGFDDAFVRMETLAGESAESVGMLREEVLGLSHLGQGPQDLADTLAFITSSGFEGADALDILERSAASAAVQMGEMQSVADLLTSAMNAYGQSTYDAAEVTDLLLRAVRVGKADPDELARSLGRVLPIASELGVGLDELVASVAALSLTGLSAAEATTAVRSILTTLANPTNQARAALAEYGLTAADLRVMLAGEDGLEGVLFTLADAFDGNADAVGDMFGNVRALNGVMSLTGQNADEVRAAFDEVANSTYTLDDALERVAGTDSHRRAVALAEIQNALVGEGAGSAEAITRLYEGVADILPVIIPALAELGEDILFLAADALPAAADATAWFVDALDRLADNPIWQATFGDDLFPSEPEMKAAVEEFVRTQIGMHADAARQIAAANVVEGSPWEGFADWLEGGFSEFMFGPDAIPSPPDGWHQGFADVAASAGDATESVGELADAVVTLPNNLALDQWTRQADDFTSAMLEAVGAGGNLGDVMRGLADPAFAAAKAAQAFADAQAEYLDSDSVDNALAYGSALADLQAAVGGLDSAAIESFLTLLGSLGIDGTQILSDLGVEFDEFGNVVGGVFSGVEIDPSGLTTDIKASVETSVAQAWNEVQEAEWVQAGWEGAGATFGDSLVEGTLAALDTLPNLVIGRLESALSAANSWIGSNVGRGTGGGRGRGAVGGEAEWVAAGYSAPPITVNNTINNPVGQPAPDSLQAVGKRNAVALRLAAPGVQ